MKQFSKIFNISFLILAIIISFLNIFFGLDFLDTFYMGNLFSSDNIDVFRPITNIIYIMTINVFGDYIILLRIINWCIYLLSAIIFYKFLQHSYKISLIWLALAILSIPLIGTNVFNGNSLTLLGIILTFIFLFKYIQYSNKSTFLGLTLSLTLCIGSRFPNIVILPILLILSTFVCSNKKQYVYILSSTLSSVFLFFIINSAISGGLTDYIINIQEKFIYSENNTGGANHSIAFLIQEYLHTIKDTVSNIKYLSILFILPILSLLIRNKIIKYSVQSLFIFLNVLYIFFRINVVNDVIHYFFMMYLYALIFIVIFIAISLSILTKDYKQLAWLLVILLFSSIGASGADSGIYYMGAPLCIFLPYIIRYIYDRFRYINKRNLIAVIISLLGLSISSILYVRNGMLYIGVGLLVITFCALLVLSIVQTYAIPFSCYLRNIFLKCPIDHNIRSLNVLIVSFIMILITMGLYAEYKKPFHDKSVGELYEYSDIKELKYIVTNSQSVEFINQIMEEYYKLSANNKVIFYGRNSAIFSYITHVGLIDGIDFAQDDSEYNIKSVDKTLNQNQVLILVPYNPALRNGDIINDYPLLFNMMTTKGYYYELYTDYAIFYPQGNNINKK